MEIFKAAIDAVDPVAAVKRCVRRTESGLLIGEKELAFDDHERILVVGGGKAAAPMARALEELLGDRIAGGVIVVKEGHGLPLQHLRVHEAGHPVPDERGVEGTAEMLELLRQASRRDLVLCVISGGGSALLVSPVEGITLEDKQVVTRLLLGCGADIHEMNAVRKHLSRIKGGGLARVAYPATVFSLILSDVIGDDLNVIASGPAVADPSTFSDAYEVLKKYGVWEQVPASVQERISLGLAGKIPETPKAGEEIFQRCRSALVGTNFTALEAAGAKARQLGYNALVLSSSVEGEAREVAKFYAAIAREMRQSQNPLAPPACILAGGETTVTLRGEGKGGRNQEFALAAALAIDGLEDILILSGGTDGTDGPTDAAGALADGGTIARARSKGIDPWKHLENNDSYHFFQALGDLVMTGPTRTNVMDVYMVLVGGKG